MTPSEIATNVTGLKPVGEGNVNWSSMPTYCVSGGQLNVADDQNVWD